MTLRVYPSLTGKYVQWAVALFVLTVGVHPILEKGFHLVDVIQNDVAAEKFLQAVASRCAWRINTGGKINIYRPSYTVWRLNWEGPKNCLKSKRIRPIGSFLYTKLFDIRPRPILVKVYPRRTNKHPSKSRPTSYFQPPPSDSPNEKWCITTEISEWCTLKYLYMALLYYSWWPHIDSLYEAFQIPEFSGPFSVWLAISLPVVGLSMSTTKVCKRWFDRYCLPNRLGLYLSIGEEQRLQQWTMHPMAQIAHGHGQGRRYFMHASVGSCSLIFRTLYARSLRDKD